MRRRHAPRSSSSSRRLGFEPVALPSALLARVQEQTDAVAAADLVSEYLRTIHGPEPDHREDRERWLAWLDAVEHRPLEAVLTGRLHSGEEDSPRV